MKASVPLLAVIVLALALALLLISSRFNPSPSPKSLLSSSPTFHSAPRLKVFVADLPRSLNYGLLDEYWALSTPDSRIGVDPDAGLRPAAAAAAPWKPYPENPLIKQYSAEYWLLGDLETPSGRRGSSFAERVYDLDRADVVFVPFFATLSAEMELGWGRKGGFLKKEGNEDYRRQREVVDRIRESEAWRRSGGRDHVFVLTGKGS